MVVRSPYRIGQPKWALSIHGPSASCYSCLANSTADPGSLSLSQWCGCLDVEEADRLSFGVGKESSFDPRWKGPFHCKDNMLAARWLIFRDNASAFGGGVWLICCAAVAGLPAAPLCSVCLRCHGTPQTRSLVASSSLSLHCIFLDGTSSAMKPKTSTAIWQGKAESLWTDGAAVLCVLYQ